MAIINFQPIGSISNVQGATGSILSNPTSLQFGPDGRLYVSEQNGQINAFTIDFEAGSATYVATAHEELLLANGQAAVQSIQNHNDDGSLNGLVNRQVTGIVVTGTPDVPVLYVSSSDSRISTNADANIDTNSGVITRLTKNGNSWDAVDMIRGLPRSEENHSVNGMVLSQDGTKLYVAVGGNTNNGAPSQFFANTGEYALSGTILEVDLVALDQLEIKTDPNGGQGGNPRQYIYDLPTLDDPNIDNVTDGVGEDEFGLDESGPWGGNDGLNQAILPADAPLRIFADGLRNQYDLALTESGQLYTIDNGSNNGFGGNPLDGPILFPDEPDNPANGRETDQPGAGAPTHAINNAGVGDSEPLFFIEDGGYYGHPVPVRAVPGLEWIAYDDNGQPDQTLAVNTVADISTLVPDSVNIQEGFLIDPSKFTDDPARLAQSGVRVRRSGTFASGFPNLNLAPGSNALGLLGGSTNGIFEYNSNGLAFDGALDGTLLVANFPGKIFAFNVNDAGDGLDPIIGPGMDGFLGTADDEVLAANGILEVASGLSTALDVTSGPSAIGPNGTIWVAEIFGGSVAALVPSDIPGIIPLDLDNDGILNVTDPFLNDASNGGDVTLLPGETLSWDFDDNSDENLPGPQGLFTGLTGAAVNGTTDFYEFFLENVDNIKIATAAAGGATVIEQVSNGDATGDALSGGNSGEFLYHTGLTVSPTVQTFTIEWEVLNPTAGFTGPSQQIGGYIGTGDQSNFLKIVAVDSPEGEVQVLLENDDVEIASVFLQADNLFGQPSTEAISFELEIDPELATATPTVSYGIEGGAPETVTGEAIDLTGTAVLDAILGNLTVTGILADGNGTLIGAGEDGELYTADDILEDKPTQLAIGLYSSNVGQNSEDTFTATFTGVEVSAAENNAVTVTAVQDATEPDINGQFLVSLDKVASTETVVSYELTGTATEGIDYETLAGSVTILAGQENATIDLIVSNDSDVEGIETAILTLNSLTASDADVVIGTENSAVLSIIDDEQPPEFFIEAESSTQLSNYVVQNASAASGGQLLRATGSVATAAYTFDSVPGFYDIVLDVRDEDDGQSEFTLLINGAAAGEITLDQDTNAFESRTIAQSVVLERDDVITVEGKRNVGEPARFDKITFIPTIPTIDVSVAITQAAAEPDTNGQFTISLSEAATEDVTVAFETSDGTATAGADYQALSDSVTILAGDLFATVDLPVLEDDLLEGTEDLTVFLTGVTSADQSVVLSDTNASVLLTVLDDEVANVVSIAATADAAEPSTDGQFTVSLSEVAATDTVVSYAIGGTATSGTDYTALTGTVTIEAGQPSATITVSPLEDIDTEGNESVQVTLNSITSGGDNVVLSGTDASATLLIMDDDVPNELQISTVADAFEPDTNGQFRIALTAAALTDTEVAYIVGGTATPGEDYAALSGTVIIPAGEPEVLIDVIPIDDSLSEGLENISVSLTDIVSADSNVVLGTDGNTAVVDLIDDELITSLVVEAESIVDLSGYQVQTAINSQVSGGQLLRADADTSTATFTYNGVPGAYDIVLGVIDEDDGQGGFRLFVNGTLAGEISLDQDTNSLEQRAIAQGVTLNGNDVITIEGDRDLGERARLDTITFVPPPETMLVVEAESITDLSGYQVQTAINSQVSGGQLLRADADTSTATFTYNGVPGAYDIVLGVIDEDDGQGGFRLFVNGTLVGEISLDQDTNSLEQRAIAQGITLNGNDVITIEGDRDLGERARLDTITFVPASASSTVNVSVAATQAAAEPDTNGQFTISLSEAATEDVTVTFETSNGTATAGADYQALSDSVTITAGDLSATVALPVLEDQDVEGEESLLVTLTNVTSSDTNVVLGTATTATLTITDDDVNSGEVVAAINAGGPALIQGGISFSADTAFTGGFTFTDNSIGNGVQPVFDGTVYETERFGPAFSYSIPVAPGNYFVELNFAEIFFPNNSGDGIGERVFNVSIEGQQVLNSFDILAQTGGDVNQPIVVAVPDAVSPDAFGDTDAIDISFSGVQENAKLSGIVVRSAEGSISDDIVGAATLTITPSGGIQTSNFGNNSFQITNVGDKDIAAVVIDVTNSLYPDAVFDPFGEAGDAVSKLLTINTNGGTGVVAPSNDASYIGAGGTAGFNAIQLVFDNTVNGGFETDETIGFSIDMDPNSIAGVQANGPLLNSASPSWDIGGVSGAELIGSSFTVTFTDGSSASGQLQGIGNQAGAQALASQQSPNTSVTLTVNGLSSGSGTYDSNGPTVIVDGPIGETVRVVLTKGFIQPVFNGFFDAGSTSAQNFAPVFQDQLNALAASDFPANNAVEFQTVDVVITEANQDISSSFDFSGVPVNNVTGADQLPLGFVASVIDPSNNNLPLGAVTAPVYLEFVGQAPAAANAIRLEAEAATVNSGYVIENLGGASGSQVLSLRSETSSEQGEVTFGFNEAPGSYDIVVGTFDEADGISQFTAVLNDAEISTSTDIGGLVELDANLGSNFANSQTAVNPVIAANVSLTAGDSITIRGLENGGEYALIDYIELVPTI